MNRTHILERTQIIPADREEVFAFFSDASNLEVITPRFLRFRILTPMPVAMCAGARIEYALSLFGVPFRWRTRITRWEPGVCFVDEQESGPYSFWRHTHAFEAGCGSTTMRDRVEYALPLGPLGRAARALFVAGALERIFDHRRDAIARIFEEKDGTGFDVEMFHDGDCPLCMREVRWLRRLDRRKRIRFVDIAAPGFDAGEVGVSREALMDRIHARLPDGTILEGVEVFRRLYAAVGFTRLSALMRLPGISPLLDLGYRWFARNRLRLTGRCADNACALHSRPTGTGAEKLPAAVAFGDGSLRWHGIGDPVMGGASSGEMEIAGGIGVFRGEVSLERGGGFASVRSEEGRHDLSGFAGILARVRGDGKRYGLRLRTSSTVDGVNFQADFQPEAGVWSDVRLPFPAFRPVFRGQPAAGHPPLDPADIRTFGLIIAGRQAGPFRLELRWIRGYREP